MFAWQLSKGVTLHGRIKKVELTTVQRSEIVQRSWIGKSCCHKITWTIIDNPHTMEPKCSAFTLQQGGWVTVHMRWFFLKGLTKCSVTQ